MKRISLFAVAALLCATTYAQESSDKELKYFNHLSAGIELGTTGFGVELAAPITNYATVRTGFTMMPAISYSAKIDYESNNKKDRTIDLKAKAHLTDWKLLVDAYPFKESSFHVTAGFYVGKSQFVTAENTTPLRVGNNPGDDLQPGEGIEIDNGNYVIVPDANGIIKANVKVASFKPYLGIGWGRPVNKSGKLVSCAFDLGVQFWGKPTLNGWAARNAFAAPSKWVEVNKNDIDDDDFEDAYNVIRKIIVYPVLNFRLYFNCF